MQRAGMLCLFAMLASLWIAGAGCPAHAVDRPNILWISAEDISPDLGCYGDPYAITPRLDQLAADSVRYTHCFSHAGVCAPARSGLITGMYPSSIGTQHMRCQGVPPVGVKCFPEYLRAAGYYCTNNVKTDYQFGAPASAWDENSNRADWRGRSQGQPFFCVLNFTTTHESQIRDPSPQTKKLVAALPEKLRHDPAHAVLPPYYPDTPKVRQDLANYADNITALDRQVAVVLEKLAADGLAEDTIVWFWGDHGRGLPRGKRWLYDSGTRVPLLIHVPEKWRERLAPGHPERLQPGTVNEDLVAFVDFAPTILSIAGIEVPSHLQGQAFLGAQQATSPRQYVYGHRDRMDETYDLIRMVRDRRFKYLRNFMPNVTYGQELAYMDLMPTMQELRRLHAEGKLSPAADQYFRPTKPVEELFDTVADPHELHNLAADPQYAADLVRLRTECQRWMDSIGDVGLIPEPISDELKRPGARMVTTAAPIIHTVGTRATEVDYRLESQWPGTSLLYAIVPRKRDSSDDGADDGAMEPPWRLDVGGVITVPAGSELRARAVRIGFQDSKVTRQIVGRDPEPVAEKAPPPHWRELVDAEKMLPRLWQLKSFDGRRDPAAMAAFTHGLQDESAAVRYWALREGAAAATPDDWAASWEPTTRRLWQHDSSPCVQILAAGLLAQRGQDEAAIAFLADQMLVAVQPSAQLQAAQALLPVAEKARPHLSRFQQATKGSEYVSRVATQLVNRLEQAE